MATFNYILGRKKDDGRYPIYLKICHGNTNTMRSMGISVTKSEWKKKSQRISILKTDDYDTRTNKEQNNDALEALMDRAIEVERIAQRRGVLQEMTAKQLMDAVFDKSFGSKQAESSSDFVQYWNRIAMQTPKSQEKYIYALKAVTSYQIAFTGKDSISFRDITVEWVRLFLSYLKETYQYTQGQGRNVRYKCLSPWSVKTYATCLKKVINCAIDDDKLSTRVLRGFNKFKTDVVLKQPYTLTMEELRELMHYPFNSMRQRMVRDLFIFSFCTMGMNLKDIYFLDKVAVRWSDDAGEIKYIREKTSKQIVVLINSYASQLRELIAPYSTASKSNVWGEKFSSDKYFGLYYNYLTYKTFSGNFQKVVRTIREIMCYDDTFTFYTARDSWATMLSGEYQLGQEYVDIGLGHSTKSLAGNHYIAIDYDKLYDAHADMLQRLFEE